jgi:hypothetical protein
MGKSKAPKGIGFDFISLLTSPKANFFYRAFHCGCLSLLFGEFHNGYKIN